MSPLDRSLQRLLKAAAQAPLDAPDSLPFGLEARTLAQWRSAPASDDFAPLAAFFRRAVIFASLITVLSMVWSSRDNGNPAAGAVALANYEIAMQLPP